MSSLSTSRNEVPIFSYYRRNSSGQSSLTFLTGSICRTLAQSRFQWIFAPDFSKCLPILTSVSDWYMESKVFSTITPSGLGLMGAAQTLPEPLWTVLKLQFEHLSCIHIQDSINLCEHVWRLCVNTYKSRQRWWSFAACLQSRPIYWI